MRSPAAGLPRGKALLRFEERPQAGDLGFRGIGPPALGLGPLALGLLGGRDQPSVAVVEPEPGRVEPVALALPATQPEVQLAAPQPAARIWLQVLVGAFVQPEPFELLGLRIVEEVLGSAEDTLVEPLLGRAVDARGRLGQELDDEVRVAPVLLPDDPGFAIQLAGDAGDEEDVRAAKPVLLRRSLARDSPRLLEAVVEEHVAADEEVLPPAFGHGLADDVDEEGHLDAVPVAVQGFPVGVDELGRWLLDRFDRPLAHDGTSGGLGPPWGIVADS